MRRFIVVYTLAVLGAVAGAALAVLILKPEPGPHECGMWVLPAAFLGGGVGATLATWAGLRLTRRVDAGPAD